MNTNLLTSETAKELEAAAKSPKRFLSRDEKPVIGDFVTIDDLSMSLELFVVRDQDEDTSIIYGIEMNANKEDYYIRERIIPTSNLIKVDDSFVTVNGVLWNLRTRILRHEEENRMVLVDPSE